MKQLLAVVVSIALLPMPAMAEGGKSGLPKKMSGFDGWHGARIDKKDAPNCHLTLPRDFGKKPGELKLLQELAVQGMRVDVDMDCANTMIPYAALDQLKRLAIEDQNRAAAELIIYAQEKGDLGLDTSGERAEIFGGTYVFPVLLGYNNLAEIIPPQKQGQIATDVCMAYYNPSSDALDLKALKARLAAQKMQPLVQKIEKECKRIEKENEQQ